MRRILPPLAAMLCLAFAPAPFPKAGRTVKPREAYLGAGISIVNGRILSQGDHVRAVAVAGGPVVVRGNQFRGEADAVFYYAGKGRLILIGSTTAPATLWIQRGGREERIQGTRLVYSPQTQQVSVIGSLLVSD